MPTPDLSFDVDGITYEIYDINTGSGLTAAQMQQIIQNAHTQASYKNMSDKMAASLDIDDRTVRVVLDDPGYAGLSQTDFVDRLNPTSSGIFIHLSSEQYVDGKIYKIKDSGSPGNPAQNTVDQGFVHEFAHVFDYRINHTNILTAPDPETFATTQENLFLTGMGLPPRERLSLIDDLAFVNYYKEHTGFIYDPDDNMTSGAPNILPKEYYMTLDELLDALPTGKELLDNAFTAGRDQPSPLVIDLDGDGIELSNLATEGGVYWDSDTAKNDGMAEATAWVTGGDGLLAIDLNGDGIINNSSELFGDQTGHENGFEALAVYDFNTDGQIDATDAVFHNLRVWVDDGDGFSEAGELYTLDDLLITQISLAYSDVGYQISGNDVRQESTITINGNSRDIVDAYFVTNDMNTIYDRAYTRDTATLNLPTLRGYGNVPTLHIAASLDNNSGDPDSLISLVDELAQLDLSEIFVGSTATDLVNAIMYRWAGVDGVDPSSRGSNIDARQLEFLEEFVGREFRQDASAGQANPGASAAYDLIEAYHIAFNETFALLVSQIVGADLFNGTISYDVPSDAITGITGLNLGTLGSLETIATGLANTSARETFWENVVRTVEYTVGTDNLSGGDVSALSDAITNSDVTLDLTLDILPALDLPLHNPASVNGTSGVDTLNGSSGEDEINGLAGADTLNGNGGNDIIDGGANNDTLSGNAGSDYLKGGTGSDTYIYTQGDGEDIILEDDEGSDTDTISFAAGIDIGDLTFTRISNTGLLIEIDNGTYTGSITIENQFNFSSGKGNVERLLFSDTSTYNLEAAAYTLTGTSGNDTLYGIVAGKGGTGVDTIYGGDGNDTIKGYGPNETDNNANTLYGEGGNDDIDGGNAVDTIYGGDGNDVISGNGGNDLLDDGAGNDLVNGGTGNDTYYYTSGNDVYNETSGTESIVLDASYTQAGTLYFRIGNDMQIYFDPANTITISGFYNSNDKKIETLDFATGTDTNLTTVSVINQGTSGNDTLGGTSGDDTIYGFGGNDTLNGSSGSNGNDKLYGGAGNDTLRGGAGNDYLDGGAGDDDLRGHGDNDVYAYVSGADTVLDSGGSDELKLLQNWTLSDLLFYRTVADLGNAIVGFVGESGNTVTIQAQFSNSNDVIETLRLYDNSTIAFSTIQFITYGDNNANNILTGIGYGGLTDDIVYAGGGNDNIGGDDGNDILYGEDGNDSIDGDNGADILYGGNGNDTLSGNAGNDILYGGAGDDIYAGNAGDDTYYYESGLDSIAVDALGGTDTLVIANGMTINDISFSNFSTDDTKIILTASVDEITVNNLRNANSSYWVENIAFNDGFITTLPNFASWVNGTASGETINGTSSAETIVAKAGNDTINAGSGNDAVHGGDGDDTLHGEGGADLLHGGVGNDIIDGGDGLDTLYGGAGDDIFLFKAASAFNNVDVVKDFNASDDVIDIADVLSGYYTDGVDNIIDFVRITDNGVDSTLQIDQNGGGNSFVTVATIMGVTGLTDEQALLDSGVLQAA
jgi:Ca2+-binding RTX toxin-like protein